MREATLHHICLHCENGELVYKQDEYRIPTKNWIMQLIDCLIGD